MTIKKKDLKPTMRLHSSFNSFSLQFLEAKCEKFEILPGCGKNAPLNRTTGSSSHAKASISRSGNPAEENLLANYSSFNNTRSFFF